MTTRAVLLFLSGIAPFCLLTHPSPAQAAAVRCHVFYGGEERTVQAQATETPYAVPTLAIGSFFHFRIVFQRQPDDLSAIRVYTYTDRNDTRFLIHQATYPVPPATHATYGFTGFQSVYEPLRESELQYWCEWRSP